MKRLLRSFVRFFPRHFRERFAEEMLDQIEQDYERAHARGRLHGTRFSNLEEQAKWLARYEVYELPCTATLRSLRATKLSL